MDSIASKQRLANPALEAEEEADAMLNSFAPTRVNKPYVGPDRTKRPGRSTMGASGASLKGPKALLACTVPPMDYSSQPGWAHGTGERSHGDGSRSNEQSKTQRVDIDDSNLHAHVVATVPCAADKLLLRPWYTSRTQSYTVSGAAMGQENKDVLNLGISTKGNFSHFSDTGGNPAKSIAGGKAMSTAGRSRALSYTTYDDDETGGAGNDDDIASNAKTYKTDLLVHFDHEAEHVLDLIQKDANKTFGFEVQKKKKKRNLIMAKIEEIWNDLLLPPAMRPQFEKEQAALKKEKEEEARMAKLKSERDWQRAGGLKTEEDDEKSAAARLLKMKKELGEGEGERMKFEAVPVNGYREQGRFGSVPQRNLEYIRKIKFVYKGERWGGMRDGQGTQTFSDDYMYAGEWVMNQREGFGSLEYPDGSLYEGQFYRNEQHGFGVLKTKDGKIYKGAWELGKKHGFGEMPDKKKGLIFSGQWAAGKRHGFGIQLDLKTGDVYSGQWELGLKHGLGIMKQHNASFGAIRTFMDWNKGKMIRQEPYDILKHGTECSEASMWAAHYSKECAMDAELAVAQKIAYPECPVRPKAQVDYEVQRANEQVAQMEADAAEDQEKAPNDMKEDRMFVSALEFRRLISLVHSDDKLVEELVLPILNDAEAVEETETEGAGFLVGPIWDQNLLELSHHFAIKIQRKFRRSRLKRMVQVAREESSSHLETDEQRGERLLREIQEDRVAVNQRLLEKMEEASKDKRALQEACDIRMIEDHHKTPIEFLQKTRQLFRLEMREAPSHETRSRMFLIEKLAHRLKMLSTKENMWKVSKAKMKNAFGMMNVLKNKREEFSRVSSSGSGASEGSDDVEDKAAAIALAALEKSKMDALMLALDEEIDADDFGLDLGLELGSYKYTDGSRYFGELVHGLPHGFGATLHPDGSIYNGQYRRGDRDGLGEYTAPIGDGERSRSYSGEWTKGKRNGFAVERIMLNHARQQITKACAITEYFMDMRVTEEDVGEGANMNVETISDWLFSCAKVVEHARGAKLEAEKHAAAEAIEKSMKATQSIEFDSRYGMDAYTGNYNAKGQRHGLGLQTWHDGQLYAGNFENGLPSGGGRESYPNKTWYIGEFKDGLRHGWGKYQAQNGIIYLGQWQKGMRHGFGVEHETQQNVVLWMAYVTYQHNEMQALTSVNPSKVKKWLDMAETAVRLALRTASTATPGQKVDYPDENPEGAVYYVGGILSGVRAGVGLLAHKNGTQYIGEWASDKKNGLGVETYTDESTYKGEFRNGQRHGLGEYCDAKTERMYRGSWNQGARHGKGWERAVLTMISGRIFKLFLIEYENDVEIGRRFITKTSRLEFLEDVLDRVKRAEEIEEFTAELYEDMLD